MLTKVGRRESSISSAAPILSVGLHHQPKETMQNTNKRVTVIAGFAILLAVLFANSFVTRRELGVQNGNQERVASTRQVLYQLSETETLLLNAQSGQRGFLYTGNETYLAPYDAAFAQVQPHIQALARLTAANPREQALVTELGNMCQLKLAELAQTISLYRAGKTNNAKALVVSDAGLMDKIRGVIGELQHQEDLLEATRESDYQKSVRRTVASIYLANLLAVVGLVVLAYSILRGIEMREKHAAEMRAREQWLRVTLTSIGDAVIATDQSGSVTFLNPVAEKLLGTSAAEALKKDSKDAFPIFNELTGEPGEDPVKKVLEFGSIAELANHTVLRNSNGSLIPIEDSAAPIRDELGRILGVVLVFRDVTRERKAQAMARRTEKLAAAARLSATMAHEINNPLEAIMNLIYIARTSEDPAMVAQSLTLADQELDRLAHLTRQTFGFYRESKVPEPIEIPALVESVLKLHSNRLKNKNITVERNYGDCPPVCGIPGELRHAVANLISNATDAVDINGTIWVRSECLQVADGGAIEITFEDDGPGVAREDMERIFEPFFTTKEDVGTGLGLWITREIVNRHGGSILVRSRGESGSTRGAAFVIRLPLTADLQTAALGGADSALRAPG